MYDHLATSIPSDIHLISSSAMISAHEQFYQQMFGSLADVVNHQQLCHPMHTNQLIGGHQKLRNTKSTTASTPAAVTCNQDHLFQIKQLHQHHLNNQQQQASQFRSTNKQQQQQSHCNQQQYRQCHQANGNTTGALYQQAHYLTIEELKSTRNSCWLCGCNWQEDHVSLDCPECDGYALSRPCPNCDGKCKQIWQRDITETHDKHRALWTGHCAFEEQQKQRQSTEEQHDCDEQIDLNALQQQVDRHSQNMDSFCHFQTTSKSSCCPASSSNFHLTAPSASSLCSSHPSSAASSDDEPDDFLSI